MISKNLKTILIVVIILGVALGAYQFLNFNNLYNNQYNQQNQMRDQPQGVLNILPDEAADVNEVNENFEGDMQVDSVDMSQGTNFDATAVSTTRTNANRPRIIGSDVTQAMNVDMDPAAQQLRAASCFPKEQISPQELLPQDNSSQWAQVYPSGEGSLKNRNFLQASNLIGINTVGQTLRNANLQLRSEPPNPQVAVSPWMQSTIDPDTNRRPLEIGGCY
jgi:hypothetical protein